MRAHLEAVATETLADAVAEGPAPAGWPTATVALIAATATIALRRRDDGAAG